jgi:tetratricopeptide (TPR) repeat protein
LRRKIDDPKFSLDDARAEYDAMVKRSIFTFPLHWARTSLRDRYATEADGILAGYRDGAAVSSAQWSRAQADLNAGLSVDRDDKTIRGKSSLVNGFIRLNTRHRKDARADFEEAHRLLPHSPDPHLGLALCNMQDGDLDKAVSELDEAKRNGFQPGRREQKQLADAYRSRGEKLLAAGGRMHDIERMQDYYHKADSDLAHAEELYTSVAPFEGGEKLAERISQERDRLARTLAQAELARSNP